MLCFGNKRTSNNGRDVSCAVRAWFILRRLVVQLRFIVVRKRSWQRRPKKVQEPTLRGTSYIRSHYQATASKDYEDFMCAVVTVTFGVCNSV
jgi:hypothetical protein